jgi:hypothetical protein
MTLDKNDAHNSPRGGVVARAAFFVFLESTLHVCCDAGIQRTIFALEDVDKVTGIHTSILQLDCRVYGAVDVTLNMFYYVDFEGQEKKGL